VRISVEAAFEKDMDDRGLDTERPVDNVGVGYNALGPWDGSIRPYHAIVGPVGTRWDDQGISAHAIGVLIMKCTINSCSRVTTNW
jgi:hypothetical protein